MKLLFIEEPIKKNKTAAKDDICGGICYTLDKFTSTVLLEK